MKLVKSYDKAYLQISEHKFNKLKDKFHNICDSIWDLSYITSTELLVFNRIERSRPDNFRTITSGELQKKIIQITKPTKTVLNWAYTPVDKPDHYFLPTGKIFIFFDKNISIKKRVEILNNYPNKGIEHLKNLSIEIPSEDAQSKDNSNDYTDKSKIKETKKRKRKILIPITKITLPSGEEDRSFEVASNLRKHPEIVTATADADLIFPYNEPPVQLLQWVHYDPLGVIGRNFIHRAWELMPPDSFDARQIYVAVFDKNFYEHTSINFQWIGYDAADGDCDPRDPVEPPYMDVSGPSYPNDFLHGTEMAGMIAGRAPDFSSGVAPNSIIIPFRSSATDPSLTTTDEEYWVNKFYNYLYSFCRMSQLSYDKDLSIVNISLEIDDYVWTLFGLTGWLDWYIQHSNSEHSIFISCAAGNNPDFSVVPYPARCPQTFAVGYADWETDHVLGSSGIEKDIVVDIGRWPGYYPNNSIVSNDELGGDSSIAAATVSGVAALMQRTTSYVLIADEIKDILKLSTRLSPRHLEIILNKSDITAVADPQYGYGFLDAYHAVKIAYKDKRPAVQAVPIKYLDDGSTTVLIQMGGPNFYGYNRIDPTGIFWNLQRTEDALGIYWSHIRVEDYHHWEIFLDPFATSENLIIGDFNGDGKDEIALQKSILLESQRHNFTVKKHNADRGWVTLGQTPEDTDIPLIWPTERLISQTMTVIIDDSGKEAIISRQEDAINIALYDSATDRWTIIPPQNYIPPVSSPQIVNELLPFIYVGELIHIAKFIPLAGPQRDSILVLGLLNRTLFWSGSHQLLTASIIEYDPINHSYQHIPLDHLNNTHIILMENRSISLQDVIIADVDNDGDPEAVLLLNDNTICLLDIHRTLGERMIYGYSVEISQINLDNRISRFHHGDVTGDGKEELVYLGESSNGNLVHFLSWNPLLRIWQRHPDPLWHGRPDNIAVDIVVGDYDGDNLAEVGILMERPHRNIYRVFHMIDGAFEEYGIW